MILHEDLMVTPCRKLRPQKSPGLHLATRPVIWRRVEKLQSWSHPSLSCDRGGRRVQQVTAASRPALSRSFPKVSKTMKRLLSRLFGSKARPACPKPARRASLGLEALEDRQWMTAGFLDPTFGSRGGSSAAFDLDGGVTDQAQAVAIQPDGKIVVAGSAQYGTSGDDDSLPSPASTRTAPWITGSGTTARLPSPSTWAATVGTWPLRWRSIPTAASWSPGRSSRATATRTSASPG